MHASQRTGTNLIDNRSHDAILFRNLKYALQLRLQAAGQTAKQIAKTCTCKRCIFYNAVKPGEGRNSQ